LSPEADRSASLGDHRNGRACRDAAAGCLRGAWQLGRIGPGRAVEPVPAGIAGNPFASLRRNAPRLFRLMCFNLSYRSPSD